MPPQTAERKAYRQRYYQNEPQSVKDARKIWKRTAKGKRCVRNTWLKSEYGITVDQYDALLVSQNGRCAICEAPASEFKKCLHLDHNHRTGKVRGLLCTSCNTRLVAALEDPLLPTAKAYLAKWAQ